MQLIFRPDAKSFNDLRRDMKSYLLSDERDVKICGHGHGKAGLQLFKNSGSSTDVR